MVALLLNALVLGGLLILIGASASALKEGIKQKARLRGILLASGLLLVSLALVGLVLI